MVSYWNLRKLLGANPNENQCVGTTKTVKPPRRCRNSLNASGRAYAERLLNEMDSQKIVSLEDLEELAEVMLCRKDHNSPVKKPHLMQVGEVRDRWHYIVKEHIRNMERKKGFTSNVLSKAIHEEDQQSEYVRVREALDIFAEKMTEQVDSV
jgi:hypothetical protein